MRGNYFDAASPQELMPVPSLPASCLPRHLYIHVHRAPASGSIFLLRDKKMDEKKRAPMSPCLLAHRIVPDWLTRADIPVRPLVAVRRALAARVLGAALTGHPCPGRAGSPSLVSPAHCVRGNTLRALRRSADSMGLPRASSSLAGFGEGFTPHRLRLDAGRFSPVITQAAPMI